MDYEWDDRKNARNRAKHGVAFEFMLGFEWETCLTQQDTRRDYGEDRFVSYGLIDERLYVCVHTRRGRFWRIVSLRKANDREREFYEKTTETPDHQEWRGA